MLVKSPQTRNSRIGHNPFGWTCKPKNNQVKVQLNNPVVLVLTNYKNISTIPGSSQRTVKETSTCQCFQKIPLIDDCSLNNSILYSRTLVNTDGDGLRVISPIPWGFYILTADSSFFIITMFIIIIILDQVN